MKAPWLGPRSAPTDTQTDRGARALLVTLREAHGALMTKQLSAHSGLRPQTCSIALHTLRQLGMVSRTIDQVSRRYVWRWTTETPALARREPVEKHFKYSVQEASDATGLSMKALRRRIERGTLACTVDDRQRFISYEALQQTGLTGDATGNTQVEHTTRQLIRVLAFAKPGTEFTIAELQRQSALKRQDCETSLAVFLALAFVGKSYSAGFQQYTWSWIGPRPI